MLYLKRKIVRRSDNYGEDKKDIFDIGSSNDLCGTIRNGTGCRR